MKKQRSTSNSSSESSGDSSLYSGNGGGGSGRGSPMSPASSASQTTINRSIGSPVKSGNGVKGIAKIELFRQGGTQYEPQTMVSRNLREETAINASYVQVSGNGYNGSANNVMGNGSNDVIFFIERPLEKIDERHTESESEPDNDTDETNNSNDNEFKKKVDNRSTLTTDCETKDKIEEKDAIACENVSEQNLSYETKSVDCPEPKTVENDNKLDLVASKSTTIDVYDEPEKGEKISPSSPKESLLIQRRFSEHKSFEMEDIPDENPIKCHPEGLAQIKNRGGGKFVHAQTSSQLPPRHFHHKQHHHHEHLHYRVRHFDNKQLSRKSKLEYPIVRHHPLFAKQPKSGCQSNFSSLLLGQNVRVIRRSKATAVSPSNDNVGLGDDTMQKYGGFEIFNPETDDLSDSDEELDDNFDRDNNDILWNNSKNGVSVGLPLKLNKDDDTSESTSSSSSPDSNDSVESVVSARTDERLSAMNTTKATGSPISPNSKSSSASITPVQSNSLVRTKTSPSPSPVLQHQQLQQQTSTTPSILLITEISDKEDEENSKSFDEAEENIDEVRDDEPDLQTVDDETDQEEVRNVRPSSPIKHSQSLDEKPSTTKVDEFILRSERRRQSLMNLLGENQNVITNIKGKMGGTGLSSSESSGSIRSCSYDTSPLSENVKRTLDKIQEVTVGDELDEPSKEAKILMKSEKEVVGEELTPTDSKVVEEMDELISKLKPISEIREKAKKDNSDPDVKSTKKEEESNVSTEAVVIQDTCIKGDTNDSDELIGKLTGAKPKKITSRKSTSQSQPSIVAPDLKLNPIKSPKHSLPSIVIPQHTNVNIPSSSPLKRSPLSPIMRLPRPANRGRLDKARSVSPSSCGAPHEIRVFRQSSVPTRFDETLFPYQPDLLSPKANGRESKGKKKGQLLQPCIKEEDSQKQGEQSCLDVVSPSISDVSGSGLHSSRESLCGSFESFEQNRHQISSGKSKSPSPCRSEKSRNSSGTLSSNEGDTKRREFSVSIVKDSCSTHHSKGDLISISSGLASKNQSRPLKETSMSDHAGNVQKPSNDDLLATEYLISTTVPEVNSSGSSRSISKESSLECPYEPSLGLEKLNELDPRYNESKRRRSSGASTSVMGSCNSDTDTTSQSGVGMAASLPYRRFDISYGHPPSRSHRVAAGRDDSVESTTSLGIPSAKSSAQYSDTSSLLSHRFSTISMSSNVSSSDISFGNMTSGSFRFQ